MCWPLLASKGATPASEAKAASLLTRPGWDQLISSWAATTGPTPGSASSAGPAGCSWIRRASSGSMSASWPVRNRMRAVMDCMVRTVIRCSTGAAAVVAVLSIKARRAASGRPRRGARRESGATTMRLLSSSMALVRLTRTAWQVADRALIASRSPRTRGLDWCSRAIAVAARTASSRSFFEPRARLSAYFNDVLTSQGQFPGQPGGEAPRPLQGLDPAARGMFLGPVQHPGITCAVRRCLYVGADSAGGRIQNRQVDGVPVRITSDDVVIVLCQPGCGDPFSQRANTVHAGPSGVSRHGSTVKGHARGADKLLIKPGPAGQAGAGSSRATSNGRHARTRPAFSESPPAAGTHPS